MSSGSEFPAGYLQEDTSWQLIAVSISFIVVETLGTLLRTCARYLQKASWMWSDIFMPFSLLFNLGLCTCGLRE